VAALGILLGTVATMMGQFALLAIPVFLVMQLLSGSTTPMESMPFWLRYVMLIISSDAAFRSLRADGALSRCRLFDCLAAASGACRTRQRVLRVLPPSLPPCHLLD
jgi:ABC-2 type transport system permease protein